MIKNKCFQLKKLGLRDDCKKCSNRLMCLTHPVNVLVAYSSKLLEKELKKFTKRSLTKAVKDGIEMKVIDKVASKWYKLNKSI